MEKTQSALMIAVPKVMASRLFALILFPLIKIKPAAAMEIKTAITGR